MEAGPLKLCQNLFANFFSFYAVFFKLFLIFVDMKSWLFEESPKTLQTHTGRWVRVFSGPENGYALHDMVHGIPLGRLLVDEQDYWIYDGNTLDLDEQDEVAGIILGHQNEMEKLFKTLNFGV